MSWASLGSNRKRTEWACVLVRTKVLRRPSWVSVCLSHSVLLSLWSCFCWKSPSSLCVSGLNYHIGQWSVLQGQVKSSFCIRLVFPVGQPGHLGEHPHDDCSVVLQSAPSSFNGGKPLFLWPYPPVGRSCLFPLTLWHHLKSQINKSQFRVHSSNLYPTPTLASKTIRWVLGWWVLLFFERIMENSDNEKYWFPS